MKSLKQYISEVAADGGETTLNKVTVTFKFPEDTVIEAPVMYGIEDISIYLEDTLLPKLPGGEESDASKLFGDNIKNITDMYLNYDSFDNADGGAADIKWNRSYNPSKNSAEMKTVRMTGLSYIIEFSKFVISGITDKSDAADKMYDIMEYAARNNDGDKETPALTIDKEDVKYL